ncbi:MAG TPA: LecA/PA-IL family lectin [Pyrinomonadaceae bacterium]|nr:LecA/PA-IL family lectin [Pyrinomonadaceae bacterium]
MIRLLISFLLIALLSVAAFADTIRLKDGSIIKGKITGFSGGKFVITIGDGARQRTLTFDADQVESIEFDAVPAVARNVPMQQPPVNVRSTPRETPPASGPVRPQPTPIPSAGRQPPTIRTSAPMEPVELSVRVLADNTTNGWTNSGWVVRKGQRIRIIGDGEVSLGQGRTSTPAGLYEVEDAEKLMQAVPTGALLAVIGDDNNDFIYVGAEREFTAQRDGPLFLGLNEGNLDDNSGAFTVKIEILPEGT